MKLYDVVTKLVGPIQPVGETQTDEKRLENLKEMADLVDKLIRDIAEVSSRKDSPEYSVSKAGKYADKFLTELGTER
jgi:hypothetical protein